MDARELGPPRAAKGRFTSASASFHGKRGAVERERRFLERLALPEVRKREERERLREAIAVLASVYGPVWRPRGRLRRELQMAPAIAEAVGVLVEALDGDDPKRSFRAARIVLNVVLRRDSQIFSWG